MSAAAKDRLGFFKLNVPDMERALAFWAGAFGFAVTASFDEADFLEHILALPEQEDGPNLLLVQWKDGRDVTPGSGHGPVGLVCEDIAAAEQAAVDAGAAALTGIFAVGPVKVAMLKSPEGHEIELIQHPA
jgi:predicted enzyme related to lactoylglutathione lyase